MTLLVGGICSAQLRAARGLLGWARKDLAHYAAVAEARIEAFEKEVDALSAWEAAALLKALAQRGVRPTANIKRRGVSIAQRSLPRSAL